MDPALLGTPAPPGRGGVRDGLPVCKFAVAASLDPSLFFALDRSIWTFNGGFLSTIGDESIVSTIFIAPAVPVNTGIVDFPSLGSFTLKYFWGHIQQAPTNAFGFVPSSYPLSLLFWSEQSEQGDGTTVYRSVSASTTPIPSNELGIVIHQVFPAFELPTFTVTPTPTIIGFGPLMPYDGPLQPLVYWTSPHVTYDQSFGLRDCVAPINEGGVYINQGILGAPDWRLHPVSINHGIPGSSDWENHPTYTNDLGIWTRRG